MLKLPWIAILISIQDNWSVFFFISNTNPLPLYSVLFASYKTFHICTPMWSKAHQDPFSTMFIGNKYIITFNQISFSHWKIFTTKLWALLCKTHLPLFHFPFLPPILPSWNKYSAPNLGISAPVCLRDSMVGDSFFFWEKLLPQWDSSLRDLGKELGLCTLGFAED